MKARFPRFMVGFLVGSLVLISFTPAYPQPRPHPVFPFQVMCEARDTWGKIYFASGYFPPKVQKRALDDCYYYSGYQNCYPLGCRYH